MSRWDSWQPLLACSQASAISDEILAATWMLKSGRRMRDMPSTSLTRVRCPPTNAIWFSRLESGNWNGTVCLQQCNMNVGEGEARLTPSWCRWAVTSIEEISWRMNSEWHCCQLLYGAAKWKCCLTLSFPILIYLCQIVALEISTFEVETSIIQCPISLQIWHWRKVSLWNWEKLDKSCNLSLILCESGNTSESKSWELLWMGPEIDFEKKW